MTRDDERVLVVPRDTAFAGAPWHGLRREVPPAELARLEGAAVYRSRSAVEPDPSWKQLIPYLVLRDGPRWFLMHRTRAGVDARLHDAYSIGVGGHLNPGDAGIEGGLRREWDEELVTALEPRFELVGLLNDDTTDVGSVHLGVVFAADAAGEPVAIRETHKLSAEWAPDAAVGAVRDRLETWSRIVFDALADAR
jgi:predicted NUDIX family phosphoesterase